ncbi:sugar transferase [Brevundimonas sp. NPDC092305]|uniref:sugar transferase n=1 Tax=Brevundimonas sp. NPDC092305 TaxID=3363957 RepID=UPI0037FF55A7
MTAIILLVSVVGLPLAYALAAEGARFSEVLTDERAPHVVLNAGCSALIMFLSLGLNGRLDRKLAAVLAHVLLVHGVLAFTILVTRQWYSNKVMLTAAATSAVLGSLVMLARHVSAKPRIALLGRWHPLALELKTNVDHVEDPSISLNDYDILLSSDMLDLSPEWSGPVAQAMLRGRQVRHLAEFVEESQGIVSIDHFDLEHLSASRLNSYRLRKRLIDLALVTVAAPFAVILVAIGALAVWLTMGRPLLFNQTRVGLGGHSFRMYKLRTMRVAATTSGQATLKGDSRITRIGQILRRFRIDELPQLLNVLKGDMSIIGPRPEWDVLSREYTEAVPAYAYRSLVRPGITGWAQVRAGYASNIEETRIKLTHDLFYVKNISFALDMQILVRTIWTLIGGGGAR